MFEKFTDRARVCMQLANQEAFRFNHEYIGTEHLILGLVKEGRGVGTQILQGHDIDRRKIRLEVEKLIQAGPNMVTMGRLPMTPRAKKVIEYAMEESRDLKDGCVGTQHLLLGLLREEEGVAAQVLNSLGITLTDVREDLLHIKTTGAESDQTEVAAFNVSISPISGCAETLKSVREARAAVAQCDAPSGEGVDVTWLRAKLWCDVYVASFANSKPQGLSRIDANLAVADFDIQFPRKTQLPTVR